MLYSSSTRERHREFNQDQMALEFRGRRCPAGAASDEDGQAEVRPCLLVTEVRRGVNASQGKWGQSGDLHPRVLRQPSNHRASEGRPVIAYLGSKANQADWIATYISSVVTAGARVADVFSGTGIVSAALKASGLSVVANDHLLWAFHATRAALMNDHPPSFKGLDVPTGWVDIDRYDTVLRYLNHLPPIDGFMSREYSPSGPARRRYLTTENAERIAAIRQRISQWSEHLTAAESSLLISDLIASASAVSNTAGTYGSYLKQWKRSALSPLQLQRSPFIRGAATASHEVYLGDANRLVRGLKIAAVYADPPYTKRQYAAYYHVLETIAACDEPLISGSTGLRPWEHLSSPYCFRRHAGSALQDLVSNSLGRHFFLSYNDAGQIRHSEILDILGAYGTVAVREYQTRRYRSSEITQEGTQVLERFYHLDREGHKGQITWL